MLRGVHNNVAMPVRFMASFHSIAQNMQGFSRSYYEVLNVPLNSSGKEIKQAFFELSKKYHPDGNSGAHDSDEFVKVCEAYRILYKRASREHYTNRLRSRYHTMAPVDICWTNKNVHKNWTKFQAAIRHKQCGHELTIISVPIVLYKSNRLERPKKEVRLLPAGNLLPVVKKFDPGEVLRLPPPFTQSEESWLYGYYMAAFGMVLALLVLDSSKRAKYTSDLNDQIVSRQRSFKYFSGLLSVICQT